MELTGEYQWITLSLNGKDFNGEAIDKTLIKAVGLQISSPNGQGKMTLYVDDVTLDEKEPAAGAGETSLPEERAAREEPTGHTEPPVQEKPAGEETGTSQENVPPGEDEGL